MLARRHAFKWLAVLLLHGAVVIPGGMHNVSAQEETTTTVEDKAEAPETDAADDTEAAPDKEAVSEPTVKPKFELFVPSTRKLLAELRRSRTNVFTAHIAHLIRELQTTSAEGVDTDEMDAVWSALADWPDTSVELATFARDREGRPRWAVRLGMPVERLAGLMRELLQAEVTEDIFEGIEFEEGEASYTLRLNGNPLAHLRSEDDERSNFASQAELTLPDKLFAGEELATPVLLATRLNLAKTEKDSGATFLSKFRVVTSVDYSVGVNEDGDWVDGLRAHWPPVSGMAMKAVLGRAKQTFFVPDEAFGSAVFNSGVAKTLVEEAASLGASADPNGSSGTSESTGPIGRHAASELCLTVLPGTGFLPAPDIVAQCRVNRTEEFVDKVRERTQEINRKHRLKEESEPWEEVEVREHTVFWSDVGTKARGMSLLPFVMRPVIFVNQEADAKGRSRDFLIVGWTSTNPERFVRRWLDLPRGKDPKYLPNKTKTNGQLWINWHQLYTWVHPYFNLSLSAVSPDTVLPSADEVAESMTDGTLTARLNYEELRVQHQGPVPLGLMAVPMMASAALAEDRSGGNDLARERLASRQLKVLYHHAKLFHKDIGRWPAEVAELDGYIDFAGHPQLLRLKLSSTKRWSDRMQRLFKTKEEDEQEDEEDEQYGHIDDSLYVVDWEDDQAWTLGIAEGKLEHLDKLYIDREGVIHRLEKQAEGGAK